MFATSIQKQIPGSLACALLFIAGCGPKPTYKLSPLEPRTCYDQLTKKTETGDVSVRCTTLSRNDIRSVFGKQGDALLGLRSHKRIIPVQLYIENNSGYTWSLSPYDVRLPLADMQKVKGRFLKAATKKGLASFTLGSGFGIAVAGLGATASIFHPILGASMIGAGCSMMFMAPVISHNKTAYFSEQNTRYSYLLDDMTLTEDLIIHPQQNVSKLIFVENNQMQDHFALRLCNHHNDDHTMLYNLYLDQKVHRKK
jgi:hypothetical protein